MDGWHGMADGYAYGTHSTVGKRAKRMPDVTVETTFNLVVARFSYRYIYLRSWGVMVFQKSSN